MRRDIAARIREMMSILFRIDEAAIPPDASMDTVAKWDSLAHLDLMTAIQEEFKTNFTLWEIENMTSLAEIVRQVEAKCSRT